MNKDYFPNGGWSIWRIRGGRPYTGSTFVDFWYLSEEICTVSVKTVYIPRVYVETLSSVFQLYVILIDLMVKPSFELSHINMSALNY